MDLQKAREKFAEINLKHGFYTQKELKFTDLGVFECTAAEQDFDMWWECLIYYAQPLIDQKEKALLEQFEINNKLVEQIEELKAKAQAVPGKTVQLHLVWNENKDECVGFLNQGDAHYTATGNDGGAWGVTALGDYFRDLNDESDEFETQIVMIEAQGQAND